MPVTTFSPKEEAQASDVIFYHINVPFSSFYSMASLKYDCSHRLKNMQ
jgi:hypothetical protein